MDEKIIKVLLIEDDEDDYIILRNILSGIGNVKYDLDWVKDRKEALGLIKDNDYDVFLMDYRLGEFTGIDLIDDLKQQGYETPIIMMTGQGNFETDMLAMKHGANDYLEKEKLDRRRLERAIRYAIQQSEMMKALKRSEKKLRALSTRILETQENERRSIARELHDSVGSDLAAIKYALEQKWSCMKERLSPDYGLPMEQIIELICRSIEEIRNISSNLRPSVIDDLGILAAIRSLCSEFQKIYSSIKIEHVLEIDEHDLPEPQKIVIYRLVQEALNNVSKHSGADNVQIHLTKNSNGIELCVQDNGQGFNKETILSDENEKEGLGLQGMKERTELSNGTFEIWSEKGKGTKILVRWPIY